MTTINLIRRGVVLLAAVGASAGLAACGGGDEGSGSTTAASSSSSSGQGAAKAGSLVVADATVADSLEPDGPSSYVPANLNALNNVYEGLVNYKFKPNDEQLGGGNMLDASGVEPGLAESWEFGTKNVTFTLRQGVKSQYGNEFTADDVKYTYDRNVAQKGTGLSLLTSSGTITGVKVLSKYKVRYTTSGPAPMLLVMLASAYVKPLDSTEVKKHATSSDKWAGKWLTANAAGYGPYTVKAYSSGKTLELEPSPTYWGEKAQNAIKMLPIPDASNRYSALEKGDVNVAVGLTPRQNQQASSNDGLHLFRFQGNTALTLYPNEKQVPAFKNPKVRQAMQYAIPTDDIIKQVYLGYAFDPKSIVPPYLPGFSDASWPYTYDIAKAKALMEEAGVGKVSAEMLYSSDSATLAQLAPIVQSSLAQIGVEMKLTARPQTEILTRMFGDRDMDSFVVDLSSNVLPDLSNLGSIWTSDAFANNSFYSNEAFDAAAAKSQESRELSERQPAFDAMQKAVAEDPPSIQMAGLEAVAVTSGNVSGYSWTPDGSIPFGTLTVGSGAAR